MNKRNQYIVQSIFQDVSKSFFVKKEKNREIWFTLSQIYSSTISFMYFEAFILNTLIYIKKIPLGGMLPHHTYEGEYCPYIVSNFIISYCFYNK